MNFQESDAQFSQVNAEYEKSMSYYNLSNQRLDVICNYFTKLCSNYSKFQKKSPKTSTEIYGKHLITDSSKAPISPGNYGRTTYYFQDFCEASESVKSGQRVMMSTVQDQIISPLKLFLEQRKVFYDETNKNITDLAKKRSNYQSQVKKLQQQHATTASNIEKLSTKIAKTTDLKQLEALQANYLNNCKNYVDLTNKIHSNLNRFNVAHANFIENAIIAKQKIITQEPKRMAFLKGVFSNLITIYKLIGDNYMNFKNKISSFDGEWEEDYSKFVDSQNIIRTGILPSLFQRYPFTFDDPQLTYEVVYNRGYIEYPCYIATAKADYTYNGINVKQNQKLYIYENVNQKNVLGSIPGENKKFYIATKDIDVDKRNTALIRAPQLKLTPNHLEVQTGDLVFILSEDQNGKLCENIFGQKGIVQPEFIID